MTVNDGMAGRAVRLSVSARGATSTTSIGHATGTSSAVADDCWHLVTARAVRVWMARVQLAQVDGADQDGSVGRASAACSFLAAAKVIINPPGSPGLAPMRVATLASIRAARGRSG